MFFELVARVIFFNTMTVRFLLLKSDKMMFTRKEGESALT